MCSNITLVLSPQTVRGSTIVFTDEELRTGDPSDTIRRATMMPGQLNDSLAAHRLSLMPGPSDAAASTRSHHLSLMPGQLPSRSITSARLRSPKGTKRSSSALSVQQTSPEVSCSAFLFLLLRHHERVLVTRSHSLSRRVFARGVMVHSNLLRLIAAHPPDLKCVCFTCYGAKTSTRASVVKNLL